MSTPTSIGLPKLQIAFEAAAQQTINRSKKGYEAMIVRDAQAQGVHQLSSAALGACVQPLVGWYLTNGDQSGDEYLQAAHVIGGLDGLDFYTPDSVSFDTDSHQLVAVTDQTSRFLDSGENIKLVVQYKIDYTFGALPLPGFSELEVTQEVMTKAWLNGYGDGYQG